MSECLQGHTERCKAFNQVTGKFLCENPRDEVKLLSQSLTRYKQAAEEMSFQLECIAHATRKSVAIMRKRAKEALAAYSKLKEDMGK